MAFLPNGNVITVAEFNQAMNLGLVVVLNLEEGAADMLGGASTGTQHGIDADAKRRSRVARGPSHHLLRPIGRTTRSTRTW
ncbi:MAG: hypothetical protein M3083_04030 [Actinomycetota bacterium]|nr:hypothetical protein [Actinomycetota bacterium]MDQ6946252.1 hypothetical protein [Actinomycetota bacterium]